MAKDGLRVLGVAKATHSGEIWPEGEHDFAFEYVALVGLADPIRPEIPAAVAECREAGIRVIMITGDYPATAHAIATQAGLLVADDSVLLGLVMYLPVIAGLFRFAPPPLSTLLAVVGLAGISAVWFEVIRRFRAAR